MKTGHVSDSGETISNFELAARLGIPAFRHQHVKKKAVHIIVCGVTCIGSTFMVSD